MQYESLSWERFGTMIDELVKQIAEKKKKYEFVIGINRGGLIPSVAMSHKLEKAYGSKVIHGACTVQSYQGTEKREVKRDLYISMIGLIKPHHNILLVDDIADSGESLKMATETVRKADSDAKNIDIATLHYKPKSIVKPEFFAQQIENEVWIQYPWEVR